MKARVIVDTNRIIAALIKDSISRKILYHADIEFLGISFSMGEVTKHKGYILEKAKISEEEFEIILGKIIHKVVFIDDILISLHIEEAKRIMLEIDSDDVPFISAALATGADIWSDDEHFTKQKKIKVWKTTDLMKLL